VGFQLLAPHFEEARLLRVARVLSHAPESETGPPQVCPFHRRLECLGRFCRCGLQRGRRLQVTFRVPKV